MNVKIKIHTISAIRPKKNKDKVDTSSGIMNKQVIKVSWDDDKQK